MSGNATTETMNSARLIGRGEGELLELIGDVIRVVVSEGETGGDFALCEIHALPGGGPPPHTHSQLELMYVLEGEVEFFGIQGGGWQSFPAGPGAVFIATGGVPHTFAGRGDRAARLMVLVADGSLEHFFREAGSPVASLSEIAAVRSQPTPEQLAKVMAAMQGHHIDKIDPAAAWGGDEVEFFSAERSGGWTSMLNEAIFAFSLGSHRNGLFAAEIVQRPGTGAPMHNHGATELLHVLEGDVLFETVVEGRITQQLGHAGDTLLVPGNVPHCFRCAGAGNARLLACLLPDGPQGLEGFLREVAVPLPDHKAFLAQSYAAPSAEKLAAMADAYQRYGMPLWQAWP